MESVLSQTFTADEIIIIDDGSSDKTQKITQDFPNIRYFYQKNSGVSSARNLGIKKAKNEWIAFLDSDDEWHLHKLQEQAAFHKHNSNILMSYTDEQWIREGKDVKIPKKFQKIGKNAFLENISYCNIAPSSVVLHRSLFDAVGLFDTGLEVCEDYDLWLRIALDFEIALVNKKLIKKYAGHDDQLSYKHWGMDRFRVVALEKFLDTEYEHLVLETLIQKYMLLLKGAIKYDKIADIEIYERKLKFLRLKRQDENLASEEQEM